MSDPLANLLERLSSPRLRAPGTIESYMLAGKRFLATVEPGTPPTDSHYRRYFIARRKEGISERSLRTEFFCLKKLAQANGWPWPFAREDTPVSEEDPHAPAMAPDVIEQLITHRESYTKAEAFYIAVATTWGVRREELCRIRKRDYDEEAILIRTAHRGRRVKHLIPEVLRPYFQAYRATEHTPNAMTKLFSRACGKAGVDREKGVSVHSIRRTLRTVVEWQLAAKRLPLSLYADYTGWAKTTKGTVYGGAAMLGVYSHPEVMSSDPYYVDRLIYPIHPFLKLWAGELPAALRPGAVQSEDGGDRSEASEEEPAGED